MIPNRQQLFQSQFFDRNNLGRPPASYKAITIPTTVVNQPVIVQQLDTTSCSYHFRQQTLRAWYPIPTLCSSFFLLLAFGIFMLVMGIYMLERSKQLTDIKVRYDIICPTIGAPCSVTMDIPNNIQGPVFVYYELHDFYQNHRLYIRSKKLDQLHGKLYTVDQQDGQCSPISTNNDLWHITKKDTSITGVPLDPNGPVNPCGLIAMTYFNDSYTMTGPSGSVTISNQDIAWKGDKNKIKIQDPSVMWLNTTDQRFMNWMRAASRSDFRKLWGRINSDLPAGSYTFDVENNYDMSSLKKGQKWIAVANANNFGGKNQLLSILYIVIGSLFLLLALIIGILWWMRGNAARAKML